MQRKSHHAAGRLWIVLSLLVALSIASAAHATDTQVANAREQDDLWRQGIDLVQKGDLARAADRIRGIDTGGRLIDQVRTWLEEYEAKEAKRKELDRADFEKYVGYAKARIERKEYSMALGWALAAADVVEDRDAFLKVDWLQDLVNASLAKADEHRKKGEWREAWNHYYQLGDLYDREPRYKKLEREVLTHLRLDSMFKEEANWNERIENVRWMDAERALEYIGHYYVEPPDFKAIAESGLEQLLLLAESKTAQEQFEGLKDESAREDFEVRIEALLKRVRKAPTLARRDAVRHFRRAVKDVNTETVRLPEELVVSELMRGALEPLDDFTTVIWPQDSEEFDKHTRGDFIGVGISIVKNRVTDEVEVVTPLEGGPAYYAGIQAGDIITHVDGESLEGFTLNKVVDTITGPEDTTVELTLRRGEEKLVFDLPRQKIKIHSVKGINRDPEFEERWNYWIDQENGIGYIRVANFQRNTPEDVENVLSELQAGGLRGLILDLRGNPGGLLDSAWHISSLFLGRGENVVSTKGRNRAENQRLDARGDGPYADLPVTVLVDERSASASEIVAGAIRDNDHGAVVGARTFGKFSVQNLIPLSHSNAKLKITTARYYLPSGASLHREPQSQTWGVEPDIPVRLTRWELINLWKMRREADLLGPPKRGGDDEDLKTAGAEMGDVEDKDKAGDKKADDAKVADGSEKDDAKTADVKKPADDAEGKDDAKTADAEKSKEDELPPLEQPDENNRPMEDAQLDVALLLMRVKLIGESYPTIAAVGAKAEQADTPHAP